jgi:hypothetical protein
MASHEKDLTQQYNALLMACPSPQNSGFHSHYSTILKTVKLFAKDLLKNSDRERLLWSVELQTVLKKRFWSAKAC